jgi:hypothetical protein
VLALIAGQFSGAVAASFVVTDAGLVLALRRHADQCRMWSTGVGRRPRHPPWSPKPEELEPIGPRRPHLDVFWEGADRRIWTNWWATGTGNGWKDHLPSTIAPSWATAPVPGTGITAVARTGAHLDVFWAGVDGKIWSNWWHTGTGNGWNDHASFTI